MAVEIIWHGHANFHITSGGISVLVDPFFTGNPTCPIAWNQAPRADVVLITHDHGDHVGDAIAICRASDAQCCAIYDTAFSLVERGLPPDRIGAAPNVGGTVHIKGVQITVIPALHTSETGCPVGYVVRMPDGFTWYHSGDTALFGDMAYIGEEHAVDLALLPIGDYYTMNPAQAVKAAGLVQAKAVIPMHWGTFPPLVQSPEGFNILLREQLPQVRLISMNPGESVTL